MVRDTIDMAAIATTTVGKEEARSNPGFFFAWSNEQPGDGQHNQGGDAEIHHAVDAPILSGVTFGKFTSHEIGERVLHGALGMKGAQALICESWSRVKKDFVTWRVRLLLATRVVTSKRVQ
jgi:hypothetical protein